MLKRFNRWYKGKTMIEEFDNDPTSYIIVHPLIYTKRHWTAMVARTLITFYLKHWQWLWATAIGSASLWVAILSMK